MKAWLKYLPLLLVALLLSCAKLPAPVPTENTKPDPLAGLDPAILNDEEPIYIPDEKIVDVIRNIIEKPEGPIYYSEIKDVKLLVVHWMAEDLEGIEYFTGLEEFHLALFHSWQDRNAVKNSDYSALANLLNLKIVTVAGEDLSDLSFLKNLTNLVELYVYSDHVTDITPISHLENIEHLDLSGCPVTDISAISGMPKLRNLWLSYTHNPILVSQETIKLFEESNGEIRPFPALEELFLNSSDLDQVTQVSYITSIKKLDLSNNKISDISPLSSLHNLQSVDLTNNMVSDVTPLVGLEHLTRVYLEGNFIAVRDAREILPNATNLFYPQYY